MTKNAIFCDHCGKEIDQMIDYDDVTIKCAHEWKDVDLCEDCFNELWDFISKFCTYQEK